MNEIEKLPGGFISGVVLVDGTVRRCPTGNSVFVNRLLQHYEANSWNGAPRYLGRDEEGRDALSYVQGYVPWQGGNPAVASSAALTTLARLVRAAHDLTAGHPLADGHEVVCHNDLSPKNTVYRSTDEPLEPIALIDWDLAAPGRRVHDVAHLCWQYLSLGPGTDPVWASGRIREVADAYGLASADRQELVSNVAGWQERCWRGIESGAAGGDAALISLREAGVPEEIRAAHAWVTHHQQTLEAGLAAN
ncbi:phosphotransferase family protein [Streptomyces sp. NPDC102270]|uniref:phosphotransferase family protein n=1 Tax=Streptomyces sp. NPDC102270 TaxID=3366150 RepID=UPI0037F64F2A